MKKKNYIAVASIDFLNEKSCLDKFRYGTEEEVRQICDVYSDRENSDFTLYEINDFVDATNNDEVDIDGSFIRYIEI